MIVLGNKDLLNEKLAVILNSSQSKISCGNDRWVAATARAVIEICGQGWILVTSLGLVTWELPLHLANRAGAGQIIIDPAPESDDYPALFSKVISDFDLNKDKTAMLFLKPTTGARSPKAAWRQRDLAAVSLAQMVAPVSIRPGGRLEKLLDNEIDSDKIESKFRTAYCRPLAEPARYDITKAHQVFGAQNYIAHWTKTCHGPWPEQSCAEYYDRLLKSENRYVGSAFQTLIRIAREQKIRASSNKMRNGRMAVGFSAAPLGETLQRLRWCPRRVNWNFEPYGIVLPADLAKRIGVRPVIYGTEDDYGKLNDNDKPYFQNRGGKNVDWRVEQEWRHVGDIDLNQLPYGEIICFVWNENEAVGLRQVTGNDVFAFCGDESKENC